jgi:hypothetical protein
MFSLAHALENLRGRKREQSEPELARKACARFVRRTRAAQRATAALAGASRAWALASLAAATLLALDLALAPNGRARAAAAMSLAAASVLLALISVARGVGRRFSDRWLARSIEARFPELDGRLLAVASERGRSPAVSAFVAGVARELERASALAVPSRRALHRPALLALGATALAAGVLLAYQRHDPAQLGRAVTLADEPVAPPAAKIIAVRPGAARVTEGGRLDVEVGCAGVPREAKLLLLPSDPGRRADAVEVPLEARALGRLAATLPALVEDAAYQVLVDGERSEVYPVGVIRAPRVVAVSHRDDFPAYLAMEPREVAGGDVDAIEGTSVLVRATTSSEPVRGKLHAVWSGEGLIETIPLVRTGPRAVEATFIARHGGTYQVEYEDETGLEPRASATFTVSVRPDLPPRAEILSPAGDREIAHAGALSVEYEVRDDHGLGALALHVAVKGGKARKLPLPLEKGARLARGKLVLSPRMFGMLPGDSLLYYISAEDMKAPVPNRATSAPYVLVVEEDGLLRQMLSGIPGYDDARFRALEGAESQPEGTPESEEDLAQTAEALRRLEALVNGERDPLDAKSLTDPLEDLAPEDQERFAKALEDLDLDPDEFMEEQGKANQQQGADTPDGKKGPKIPRAKGMKVRGAGERPDGSNSKSFIMRAARTDLRNRYRALLEKRRTLLRKLAEQLALGKPIPDALARKLGPASERILELLSKAGAAGDLGGKAGAHAHEDPGARFVAAGRSLRVREEIPQDAVELAPGVGTDEPASGAPARTKAAAWDEDLPPELRAVVREYFKRR